MRTFIFIAAISLLIAPGVTQLHASDTAPLFDVPRVDGVTIDGKDEDWSDRGFRVGVVGDENGKLKPASDLDVAFRLGWDERGLLMLLDVTDDVHDEAKKNDLWYGDSVELFYAPQRGSGDVVQVVVSPGIDPATPELRSTVVDQRVSETLRKTKPTATAARVKTATGYTLEVLLPWENLGIKPAAGREIAFQVYINDLDGGKQSQVRWFPMYGARDSMKMHRLRLSDKPSAAVRTVVSGEYERLRRVRLHVAGTTDLIGKQCTVKDGEHELGSATMAAEDGRAGAKFVLPMPSLGKVYGPLSVIVEGEAPKTLNLPDLAEARGRAFMDLKLGFNSNVFDGSVFPKCDFEQPSLADDLIGPYTISTTFYDAAYNPVKTAEKTGRYGAVVEIKTEDGKTFRRLRTLFRSARTPHAFQQNITGTIEFPRQMGIDPAVTAEQKSSTAKYLGLLIDDSYSHDSAEVLTPAFMSGLFEMKPGAGEASVFDDFQARDRQWWVGLKRKLAGDDKQYPEPFVCPRPVTGKPATVLHEGSMKDAGMKADAAEKIDTLLKQWAADSDEAFAVCVARHGVIVLHKAYGQRDGKPMTVDTKSRMASITKSLSGSAIMMLVDQGLVNLDDPVTKFLPAFRNSTVPTPLTLRHLYTHTSGIEGHWGDDLNDFDDIIAGYYPYMSVGKRHIYAGADLALGGKILEDITGEALPQFYKHHLLDPLGCTHTEVTNSSYDARSTPMDMAKFGQMLLNRGSYGDKQFMSPETFQQMLPERLTKVLGPDTGVEWGVGLVWFKTEGISNSTFGHGAASSATLRIDPEHDLVITMTRNTAGRNFTVYHKKFLATIMENIAK